MRVSVIVPAFNEEKLLPRCLASIRTAFGACMRQRDLAEIIVADNNSTDRTAAVAREHGARVVFEPLNQISRARNTGAAGALGDWLLFIDADSVLASRTVLEMMDVIEGGRSAGGGATIAFLDGPRHAAVATAFWNTISRTARWAAGSFVFCRADAFRDIGGFSTLVYAGEEVLLSEALKRWAYQRGLEVSILTRQPHGSSGRKLLLYSLREQASLLLRALVSPIRTLSSKEALDFYYDGRR